VQRLLNQVPINNIISLFIKASNAISDMAAELLKPEPTVMTMTMQQLKQKTTTEIKTVNSSETISKAALTDAEVASTAAIDAATRIPWLQARIQAARDVLKALQQAAEACAEVENIEIRHTKCPKYKTRLRDAKSEIKGRITKCTEQLCPIIRH
jgi:hypothetical protein